MPQSNCPSGNELADYAVGNVSNPRRHDVLDEHLEDCPGCQATLQTLGEVDDTLVAAMRHGSPPDEFGDEPMCREALARVAAIGLDPSSTAVSSAAKSDPSQFAGQPIHIRDYRLLAKLGEGGMGAVYKALHTQLEKVVALKVCTLREKAVTDLH